MLAAVALEFATRTCREAAIDVAVAEFLRITADTGMTAAACGGWIGVGPERLNRFYFNTWPSDWQAIYVKEQLVEDDPLVAEARRSMRPFLWSELRARTIAEGYPRRVIERAEGYGWREVLAVPMHGPAGYQGLLTLASTEPVQLDAKVILLLEMMARSIHQRCRESPDLALPGLAATSLTRHQLAALRLVAVGKSDAEIARQTGVAEATAHFHVERAKKTLGVRTRAQAVALLVLAGLI